MEGALARIERLRKRFKVGERAIHCGTRANPPHVPPCRTGWMQPVQVALHAREIAGAVWLAAELWQVSAQIRSLRGRRTEKTKLWPDL
jgi:hypothetical protein